MSAAYNAQQLQPHSLFVVSLPRSLSTRVYELARSMIGLGAPEWTSAGEVLNSDRWLMLRDVESDPYVPADDQLGIERWCGFLSDTVQERGHAYKDVVQPFVVRRWLRSPAAANLRVLRLRRPLADVAWSMLKARWHYPERAAAEGLDATDRLLSGLSRASAALDQLHTVDLHFDALLADQDCMLAALEELYPDRPIGSLALADGDFQAHSRTVLERRQTPLWADLDRRARSLGSD